MSRDEGWEIFQTNGKLELVGKARFITRKNCTANSDTPLSERRFYCNSYLYIYVAFRADIVKLIKR